MIITSSCANILFLMDMFIVCHMGNKALIGRGEVSEHPL
jgi:hypothetical protein